VLHVTDDPEIRELAAGYLGKVLSEGARERAIMRLQRLEEVWTEDLWFVSKDAYLVVGPPVDTAKCAGVPPPDEPECKTTWRARFAETEAPIDGFPE
jgi:hypothetical protein